VPVDDIDKHIPLSSVVEWSLEEESDGAVVGVTVGGVDDLFEEIIGAFEFIPEERVVLAEFEIGEIHFLHGADAKKVEAGKHPASA